MRGILFLLTIALLAGCFEPGLGSSPRDCPASAASDPIVVTIPEPGRFIGYCMELNSNTLHDPILRKVPADGVVHFPEQEPERYYIHVAVEQRGDRFCQDEVSMFFDYGGGGIEVTAEHAVVCA